MVAPHNKIVVWPDGLNPLEYALALSSQPDRSSLTHCFAKILRKLFKPCRIFIYIDDYGRRIESDRNKDMPNIVVRNMLQPVESLETHCVSEIAGALECLRNQTATRCELSNGATRLVWPIRGRGGICNLLVIDYTQRFEANQIEISSMVRLFENLLNIFDQAESDSLTGLLNRKAFDKSMQALLVKEIYAKDSIKQKQKFRIFAMLDIDHFKQVNDKYGHLYGDEVLLHFARLLKESFRRHDWLFRFGGEEFSVVLEVVDLAQGEFILQRFRKTVESFDFPIVHNVTVSIGLTRINPGEAITQIVDKADKAMYRAKMDGRNRVVVFENVLDEIDDANIAMNGQNDITLF